MAKANITLRILSHLLSVTSLHFVCSCPVARFTAINTPPVRRSQPNTFACFDGGDICRPSFQQQRSLPWICWLRIRGLLLYRSSCHPPFSRFSYSCHTQLIPSTPSPHTTVSTFHT